MIKFSEEDMSKAMTEQRLGLLCQTGSQPVNAKQSSWRKLEVLLQRTRE